MQFGLNRHECLNFAFVLHKNTLVFTQSDARIVFFVMYMIRRKYATMPFFQTTVKGAHV